jgi:hypothetical protein
MGKRKPELYVQLPALLIVQLIDDEISELVE